VFLLLELLLELTRLMLPRIVLTVIKYLVGNEWHGWLLYFFDIVSMAEEVVAVWDGSELRV